jgi:hypothetical protein
VANCHRHPETTSTGVCRACGGEFCEDCLVYSYGTNRPPFCIDCAVAGVTRHLPGEIDLREQRAPNF